MASEGEQNPPAELKPGSNHVLVVTLGATALQAYDARTGGMALRLLPSQLLADAVAALGQQQQEAGGITEAGGSRTAVETVLVEVPERSGAELTLVTLCAVRDAVLAHLAPSVDAPRCAAAVLLCGTDTLEEAAFMLHLMLGSALQRYCNLLCVTGAMLPADQMGGDGAKNLRDALKVALDPAIREAARGQVLAIMNDSIHLAQYVRKADSQLMGSFCSHPGPLGQLRGGRPLLYYLPLPPPPPPPPLPPQAVAPFAATPTAGLSPAAVLAGPAWLPCAEFGDIPAETLRSRSPRVLIWTLTIDGVAPPDSLLAELDGLVLAGSGTGSLPAAAVARLSPAWTARLPVVVASRCSWGANHDDFYYRGSRAKYESRGFVLGRGYEHLNPLQARCLLVLRLAAFRHA